MEITPSPSAYNSTFVTNYFSKKLSILDLKFNFQRIFGELKWINSLKFGSLEISNTDLFFQISTNFSILIE